MAMRNPARILAAQGPRQSRTDSVARSTSPDVEGVDVAAGLCSGVSGELWGAVRLVLGMDGRDVNDLERQLYLAAVDMANENGWPQSPRGSRRIRRMVHMALLEAANPRGIWLQGAAGKIRCEWSGVLRAELLGMQPRAWRATWAKPYEEIYQHLGEWVGRAQAKIAKAARAD